MTDEKPKQPYWEIGKRIANAREQCTDMNQSQMTEALNLREPTYGNYERGARRMPPHVLEKFTAITGCRADYILLGKLPVKSEEGPPKDKIDIALDKIISGLEAEKKKTLLQLAKALKSGDEDEEL